MTISPERERAAVALVAAIDAKRNLPLGIAAACAGAIAGAIVWAGITAATHYQIGFMAIGVAYLVGLGMTRFGNGRTPLFGYVGGAIALLGSMLGNLLTIYAEAGSEGIAPAALLAIPLPAIARLFERRFDLMDLLFYAIAAYYGYKGSIRRLTPAEVQALPP